MSPNTKKVKERELHDVSTRERDSFLLTFEMFVFFSSLFFGCCQENEEKKNTKTSHVQQQTQAFLHNETKMHQASRKQFKFKCMLELECLFGK